MNALLETGNVVTNLNESSHFWNKQGKVIRVSPNGWIMVQYLAKLIYGYFEPWEKIPKYIQVGYRGADVQHLRKDAGWDPSVTAEILFSRTAGRVKILKKGFSTEADCMIKSCPKKSAKRIMVNILGTAYQADACAQHAKEYHGRLTEEFPWRD